MYVIGYNGLPLAVSGGLKCTDFSLTTNFNKMDKKSNLPQNQPLQQTAVSTSTYFTDAEIKEFKEGSLPFPFIMYEGTDPNNVIEVSEIVAISGMADNNGTPTELTIYKHVKGKETERLVYRLVQ